MLRGENSCKHLQAYERRGDHEENAEHSKCYLKMQNITGGEQGVELELGTSFVVYQHYELLD